MGRAIFGAHGEVSKAEESAALQFTAHQKVGPMRGRCTGPTKKVENHEANLMMILNISMHIEQSKAETRFNLLPDAVPLVSTRMSPDG